MDITKKEVKAWVKKQAATGRHNILVVVLVSLLDVCVAVAQAWLLANVLGMALLGKVGDAGIISHPIVLWSIASTCRALLMYGMETAAGKAGLKAQQRLRFRIIEHILRGGPSLLRQKHSAALASLVIDQIEVVEGFFSRWLPASILWIAAPLLILGIIVFIQPWVAVVLGVCGMVIPFAQAVFGIGAALAARKQFLAMARMQTRFVDRMRGIATIVLLGQVDREATHLRQAAEELRKNTIRILRVAFLSSSAIDCVMIVAIIIIATSDSTILLYLFHNPSSVSTDGVSSQTVLWVTHALFALLLVPEFFAPFRSLALAYQDRAHITSAGEEILPLEKCSPNNASFEGEVRAFSPEERNRVKEANHSRVLSPTVKEDAVTKSLNLVGGITVEFHNVGFSWEERRGKALDQLSFVIPACSTAIISGPSGAGKTTIMELLLGFVTAQEGYISFNGIKSTAFSSREHARLFSWIGQYPVLFAGTLRENIVFARPGASQQDINHAIDSAGIAQLLEELPQGLDTFIGEGGYGLSGGQAQRVAIARAYLKNAPILLLDEPTTSLDPQTELDILDSLKMLSKGRTVIIASHSAAVQNMHGQKIVLQKGRRSQEKNIESFAAAGLGVK